MDIRDFCDMVNGTLAWEKDMYEAQFDNDMQMLSHFTANIMLSSGNYKKSTKLDRLKRTLYISIKDRERQEAGIVGPDGKPVRSGKKCDAEQVKKIKEHFNIKEES